MSLNDALVARRILTAKERKEPISHGMCSCDTADLSTPVTISVFDNKDPIKIAKEYGNFIAFHSMFVWPYLNGFPGYDAVQVVIKKI